MPVLNRIAAFAEEMKGWRRHLHAHPELEFDRTGQGGQGEGHTVEHAGGATLGCLYRLPVGGLLFGGLIARFVAKDMWVAGQHFVADGADHVIQIKVPCFFGDLGVKH